MKAITTRYHGPTNTRGSRMSANDGDNRYSFAYDDELRSEQNHMNAARQFCERLGWKGRLIGGGTKNNDYVWVFASEYSPTIDVN